MAEDTLTSEIAGSVETAGLSPRELAMIEGGLKARILGSFEVNKRAKTTTQDRLLRCLYAAKGRYTNEELAEINQVGGNSTVYIQSAGIKQRTASAWIHDILLPEKGKPWGLRASTLPELSDDVDDMIRMKAVTKAKQIMLEGQQLQEAEIIQIIEQAREDYRGGVQSEARERAERLEMRVTDMMEEGGFTDALSEFIDDFSVFPSAILKGPYVGNKKTLHWINGQATVVNKQSLRWRRVSPFDVYPAPQAKDCDTGDFIEHIKLSRSQLSSFRNLPGYSTKEIDKVIEEDSGRTLYNIFESERTQAESGQAYTIEPEYAIDALHFWGSVRGQELIDWGSRQKISPNEFYEVDAILVGTHVIRAVVNDDPLGNRPYHKASYANIPGSFWGVSIYELMEDDCQMINGAARALEDNLSIASGPQIVVNVDRVPEDAEMTGIYPMKVWQTRTSMLPGDNGQPIDFFQPSSNVQELSGVMSFFESRADDATGVPRYTYGNADATGAATTSSGLSMLMSATSKGIRKAIGNINKSVMRRTVSQSVNHIMLYGKDETLKGDCSIVTQGTAALIVKEEAQQTRVGFLQATNNETDLSIMGLAGRANIIRKLSEALDMPPEDIVMGGFDKQPPIEIVKAQQQIKEAQEEIRKAREELLGKRTELLNAQESVNRDTLEAKIKSEQAKIEQARTMLLVKDGQFDERELKLKAIEHDASVEHAGATTERTKAETERRMAEMERRMAQTEGQHYSSRLNAMSATSMAQMREIAARVKSIKQDIEQTRQCAQKVMQASKTPVPEQTINTHVEQTTDDNLSKIDKLLDQIVQVQDTFAKSVVLLGQQQHTASDNVLSEGQNETP